MPDRVHIFRSACFLLILLSLCPTGASAGPLIEVNQDFVGNSEPLLPGESLSTTIVVTNGGDIPLTVDQIGTVETSSGPHGWLSVSETQLYVLPGEENALEFDIVVEASLYEFPIDVVGYVYLRSDAENEDSLVINVWIWMDDPDQRVFWDVVKTDWRLYTGIEPDRECVGLTLSSHGTVGLFGWRKQHLDYYASGFECGTREADMLYLNSGSPFVLINDGNSVSLTTSIYQHGIEKSYHWKPASGSSGLEHGFAGGYGSYEWLYTGKLLSRDGRIAIERTYYAPRSPPGHSTYVVVKTKLYSGNGATHNHVTAGSVMDWDVPSDLVTTNTSGVSTWTWGAGSFDFAYVQGTDTIGSIACQSHTGRSAAEILFHAYVMKPPGFYMVPVENEIWGAWAGSQELLRDTSLARDGSPIDPPGPDGQAWWEDITTNQGYTGVSNESNQAVWLTFLHDFELGAEDTLTFWTALTTVHDGTPTVLGYNASRAHQFYHMAIWGSCCACCEGRVGDANAIGGDEPTIGDISTIISFLFIDGTPIACLDEADVNQSGFCCANIPHVTISDISILIDYLFITGPSPGLPPCAW